MEFPNLGEQCAEKSCKQHDFLPTQCDSCKKSFCQHHYLQSKHTCSPTPRLVKVGARIKNSPKKNTKCKCSLKGCHDKNLNPLFMISCDYCSLKFCMSHRLPEDHKCTKVVAVSKALIVLPQVPLTSRTKDDHNFYGQLTKQCNGKNGSKDGNPKNRKRSSGPSTGPKQVRKKPRSDFKTPPANGKPKPKLNSKRPKKGSKVVTCRSYI